MEQNIYLIGFMGAGKSFVGNLLAEQLYCPFHDLDRDIEHLAQTSINAIFARHGEPWFRLLERRALHDSAFRTPGIIATGGGTPCFFDNMDWMNRTGTTVFLDVSTDLLVQRLWPGRAKRPLIKDLSAEALAAFIDARLAARRPFYEQATLHCTIDNTHPLVMDDLLGELGV